MMTTSIHSLPILHYFIFLLIVPFSDSIYFKLSRFDPNANNVVYKGDAAPSDGAIELINKVAYLGRVGWATYAEKVPLWDSKSGKLADFSTHFSFIIDVLNETKYGHGIAFFIAPFGFEPPMNSAGGFLGLFNTTTSDSYRNQMVHVEFDSFFNSEWDPPVEHVGINKNSIASAVYTPWNASVHSGDTTDVWINYNATTKNLSVHWSYQTTSNSQESTSLSYKIDLMKVLPEWVTVGFSAATDMYVERDTLNSWEFNSTLVIKEMSGNDIEEKRRLMVAITLSLSAFVIGLIVAFVIVRKRKQNLKKREEKMNITLITNVDFE